MVRWNRVTSLISVLGIILSLVMVLPCPAQANGDPVVNFPDANLEAAIRQAIAKPVGDIHVSELAVLTNLNATYRGISNLTGLEYCINLTQLDLQGNQISSLTPLAGLTNLTYLNLKNMQISSLTPLAGLTKLADLNLSYNQINNITPLAGLTSLTQLDLQGNQINNITPLAGLTSLTYLNLYWNQINNITPLAGLTNLTYLDLYWNQINNITPLAGLTSLTTLSLTRNQISNITPLSSLTNLTNLHLGENQISSLTPLAGLTKLVDLGLSYNQINNITPLAGLTNLTTLNLFSNQINNITPLAGLTNLTQLYLTYNQISSLTPLAGLTNLTYLNLSENQISSLTPLAGLTNLASLYLSHNQISNITPLAGLTNLAYLFLGGNQISNLTALAGLTKLSTLDLSLNQISDIVALVNNSGLAAGDQVYLNNNPLSSTSRYVHIPVLQARGVTVWWNIVAPVVTTNPATNITTTSATLNGNLTSLGTASGVNVSFHIGASSGNHTPETPMRLRISTGAVSESVTGLNSNTKYYFTTKAVGDGIAYGEEKSFVTSGASVPVGTATGTGTASFSSNLGNLVGLVAVAENTLPTAGKPAGVSFPHGLFSFNITNMIPGGTALVTITFPSAVPANSQYWQCQNGNWINCTSLLGHNNGDNILTLTITDGSLGDADGIANGTIVDPGGVAVPVVQSTQSTSSSSPQMAEKFMSLPARMTVKYLNVQPQQAQANQPVTIYANIANGGDEVGNYTATLKINGTVEETRTGKLGARAAVPLQFAVSRDKPGTYTVDINGQQTSFIIVGENKNTDSSKTIPLIGFFLCAIGVIVVLALLLRRRLADY